MGTRMDTGAWGLEVMPAGSGPAVRRGGMADHPSHRTPAGDNNLALFPPTGLEKRFIPRWMQLVGPRLQDRAAWPV